MKELANLNAVPQMKLRNGNADVGFTLVEVLTVLVILSIMSGMILTAIRGVTNSARQARTKAILEAIDHVIQEQYESYRFRPLAVEIPDTFVPFVDSNTSTDAEIGYEVLATESARVRLMMLRDLQRMEMPDRYTDILSPPVTIRAACNPVLLNSAGEIAGSRRNPNSRRMFNVNWYGTGADVPNRLASYNDRLSGSQTVEHQGAECLYLIMATSFIGGTPAIDTIPASNIGDTDGDLMPEILDGWGQPIEFIRWPIGFFDVYESTNSQLADDFDLFRSDYAYLADPPPPPPPPAPQPASGTTMDPSLPIDPNDSSAFPQRYPWSVRPLIISPGADGLFGLALNPFSDATTPIPAFNYQDTAWNWPLNANYYGSELGGRMRGPGNTTFNASTGHPFPDPYLRVFVAANGGAGNFEGFFPGQLLTGDENAESAQDNLSNFSLQAER
jgi:prepilin-type N-terminal cleavage/methylation domain-containing protein